MQLNRRSLREPLGGWRRPLQRQQAQVTARPAWSAARESVSQAHSRLSGPQHRAGMLSSTTRSEDQPAWRPAAAVRPPGGSGVRQPRRAGAGRGTTSVPTTSDSAPDIAPPPMQAWTAAPPPETTASVTPGWRRRAGSPRPGCRWRPKGRGQRAGGLLEQTTQGRLGHHLGWRPPRASQWQGAVSPRRERQGGVGLRHPPAELALALEEARRAAEIAPRCRTSPVVFSTPDYVKPVVLKPSSPAAVHHQLLQRRR